MTRTVGGQFPKGFDPVKWGIPASMVGDVDKIALWNIVTTVDAYLSAGFTPTEILEAVHPSMVASTQGTGFGGMASMRKLYLIASSTMRFRPTFCRRLCRMLSQPT